MIRIRSLLGFFSALLTAFAVLTPVQAATADQQNADGLANGLIVQYREGVMPISNSGEPTGSNSVRTTVRLGHALGGGLYSVQFAEAQTLASAQVLANQLSQDPRVAAVSVDRFLGTSTVSIKTATSFRKALTAASAVQSLKVVDAWNKDLPGLPRVQLTWKAPKSLYGAKVSYYVVEYSSDLGKSWSRINSSTATNYLFALGITAGTKYLYRVRAVTKLGTTAKLGAPSTNVAFTATSAPQAPILTSSANVTSNEATVVWQEQNSAQRGGLPVNYTVTASANGTPDVSCQSATSPCSLVGLVAGFNYRVALVASNTKGSTAASNAVSSAKLDPMFGSQWYLSDTTGINVQKAWKYTKGSSNVVVAVLDTGITKHPDLDSQVLNGYDFVSATSRTCGVGATNDGDGWDGDASDPGDYTNTDKSSWHGTHVAGIIAAAQNDYGIVGVAPNVKILPIRVLGPAGGCESDLIAGLQWAAGIHIDGVPDNKTPANVINLSMGNRTAAQCGSATSNVLLQIKKMNITTITAAGNDNMDATYSYPGSCYPTINVGATGISGDRSWYSNYTVQTTSDGSGVGVDISAPGGDDRDSATAPAGTQGQIISDYNDGAKGPGNPTFALEEGTSMSAPIVSGIVALLYSVKPTITFDQVFEVLKNSASKFKVGGDCASAPIPKCGVGIVNAGNALEYLVTHG
jgi:serine protease